MHETRARFISPTFGNPQKSRTGCGNYLTPMPFLNPTNGKLVDGSDPTYNMRSAFGIAQLRRRRIKVVFVASRPSITTNFGCPPVQQRRIDKLVVLSVGSDLIHCKEDGSWPDFRLGRAVHPAAFITGSAGTKPHSQPSFQFFTTSRSWCGWFGSNLQVTPEDLRRAPRERI